MTTLNNFPLHSLYGGWKKTLVNKRATVAHAAFADLLFVQIALTISIHFI